MIIGNYAARTVGADNWRLQQFRQRGEFGASTGPDRAAASPQHRPPGSNDHIGDLTDLLVVEFRFVGARLRWNCEVGFNFQDIRRNLQHDRTRTTAFHARKRLVDRRRYFGRFGNAMTPAGHRLEKPHLVAALVINALFLVEIWRRHLGHDV